MTKKILVTGCAGFIGSNLCETLLSMGNTVIGMDNFYTGSRKNVEMLGRFEKFSFMEHDIINPIEAEAEEIFHLASPASPAFYQKNPIRTLKINFMGTLNALGIARRNNAKILLSSTSEIYGDPLVHPQSEEYCGNVNPIGIRACYDEGKRISETLMFEYKRNHNLRIKVCRIFNTYGPYMAKDDGRVISNFINQAIDGGEMTVYGDGAQTRSFCYVSDMVDGLLRMMDSDDSFTGPVNLGTDDERTVSEIAELIKKMASSESKIVYRELPSDDPCRRRPDLSLARKRLGFNPKVGLEEGLLKTIEYFRREKW